MRLNQRLTMFLSGLLLVALGFVIGSAIIPGTADSLPAAVLLEQPAVQSQPVSFDLADLNLAEHEQHLASIFNSVSPSVVSINVTVRSTIRGENAFARSSGSGFVLNSDGYIVTNAHVVDSATERGIEVNFVDGTIVRGELIGSDPDADIAVIRVNMPPEILHPVILGDSNQLVIGQTALAIGSPFGQRWTLTAGIVSALDRTIQGLGLYSIGSAIQTDAAINPGNSGGPLFNLNGEVIGVNAQIRSESGVNSGIGFAIPINLVKRVANELIANGFVNYSYLGIRGGADISLNLIEALGLPNNIQGVVVSEATPGGPAQQAGLRSVSGATMIEGERIPTSADIITAINGVPVRDMNTLVSYLARETRPGDTVNLTIWREGQYLVLPVALTARPD